VEFVPKNALGDGLGVLAALGRLDSPILGIFCSKINSKAAHFKRFLIPKCSKSDQYRSLTHKDLQVAARSVAAEADPESIGQEDAGRLLMAP
jgi:hypothetical protein